MKSHGGSRQLQELYRCKQICNPLPETVQDQSNCGASASGAINFFEKSFVLSTKDAHLEREEFLGLIIIRGVSSRNRCKVTSENGENTHTCD